MIFWWNPIIVKMVEFNMIIWFSWFLNYYQKKQILLLRTFLLPNGFQNTSATILVVSKSGMRSLQIFGSVCSSKDEYFTSQSMVQLFSAVICLYILKDISVFICSSEDFFICVVIDPRCWLKSSQYTELKSLSST